MLSNYWTTEGKNSPTNSYIDWLQKRDTVTEQQLHHGHHLNTFTIIPFVI